MKALEKLTSLLALIFMPLNALGGIVSGIWLAILGEWRVIGLGLLFGLGGSFIIGIAMMPGLLFSVPAAASLSKGNRIGFYSFGLASAIYTFAVLAAWCILIIFFFADRANTDTAIPILLWSYGVATGPISYLAQKDLQSGNEYATFGAFFSQIGCLLSILVLLFSEPMRISIIVLFGVVMALGLIMQLAMAHAIYREQSLYGRI